MYKLVPHIRSNRFLVCIFLLVSLACPAYGQEPKIAADSVFLRFQSGAGEFEGELQTAITTYRNNEGVELDLVAAVHIGERQYYESLNEYFSNRDAVLYELVAQEDNRPDGQQQSSGTGFLGFLQTSLTSLLGLRYQLDSINYTHSNFVHADLEPDELDSLMASRGETLFSTFVSLALTEIAYQEAEIQAGRQAPPEFSGTDLLRLLGSENRRGAFKYLLGQSLASSGGNFPGSGLSQGPITILDDRNDVALDVLRSTLVNPASQKISLFYGAAHMSGLQQGIVELGFARESQSWLTAWHTP